MNPFECQFQYEPSPSSSSSTTTSTGLQNSPPTKPPPPPPPPHAQTLTFVVHDGKKKKRKNPGVTKRRIVFDGEDDQRKKFLERNRIAGNVAAKISLTFFIADCQDSTQMPAKEEKVYRRPRKTMRGRHEAQCRAASFDRETARRESLSQESAINT